MIDLSRIFISVASFLVIVTICIFGTKHIEDIINPIIIDIEKAISHANNDDINKSVETMEQVFENWTQATNMLGILLRHNEIDEIDSVVVLSLEYAKIGDEQAFIVQSSQLIHSLRHVILKEKFTLKNIF